MNQQSCTKCDKRHNLYYLIKSNNTRALFMLCPKTKGKGESFVLFVPMRDGLDIPTYLSESSSYEELKNSVQQDGEFSAKDRQVIEWWKSARLSPYKMTREQLETVKQYCKGKIRW